MALAAVNPTHVTILADRTAAYSLILSSDGTNPEASQAVLIYPDGVNTAVSANAIASTGTDATGLFTTPVNLLPGCRYWISCPNDGSWTITPFAATPIVGPVVVNGTSVEGPSTINGAAVAINGTTSVIVTSPLVELGAGSLAATNGVVRKSDLTSALNALSLLCAPYASGGHVTAPAATASTVALAE